MISTKGRYALRVVIDIAENENGAPVRLSDVAARQEISLKYLELIIPSLTKAGIVSSSHGKGGGYRLTVPADELKVGAVVRAAEGELAPVACLKEDAAPCDRAAKCKTLGVWQEYYRLTNAYFDSITVADVIRGNIAFIQEHLTKHA